MAVERWAAAADRSFFRVVGAEGAVAGAAEEAAAAGAREVVVIFPAAGVEAAGDDLDAL